MRTVLVVLFVFLLNNNLNANAPNDSLVSYDVYGEAHMFMCPFLSPKFIAILKSECNCDVTKTPDLVIHVKNGLPLNLDLILLKAEELGYERKNITFKEVN
jgi:hypothetical protein